jgi:transposase
VRFIEGADRTQPMLLPARVDDYVPTTAAVRVIDAFVASLDLLKLGFDRARPEPTGRPAYPPAELLRLYIYGYLNNLRSSRKLERACHINLEVIWLMRKLAPDFKTIADFRRDNACGISGACKAFVQFCRKAGLFLPAIAVIDGSKVAAAASRKQIMSEPEVAAALVALDCAIATYLADLDSGDAQETDETSAQNTKAALAALQTEREALCALANQMAADERALGVRGEPDARPMGSGKAAKPPAYNVQIAVDPESHLIMHHDVTTEPTDNRLLQPMAAATKAAFGLEALRVVADRGYANASQAAECEAQNITPAVPAPRPTNTRGDFYPPDQFRYDAASDSMTCPAGRTLRRNGANQRDHEVRYRAEDCSGCPLKPSCTSAPRRLVYRHVHHAAMQRMNERVKQDAQLMVMRRSTVEHPFGTIKHYLGNRFLLRGRLKAATETALAVLAYNLTRAINLRGCRALIESLANAAAA